MLGKWIGSTKLWSKSAHFTVHHHISTYHYIIWDTNILPTKCYKSLGKCETIVHVVQIYTWLLSIQLVGLVAREFQNTGGFNQLPEHCIPPLLRILTGVRGGLRQRGNEDALQFDSRRPVLLSHLPSRCGFKSEELPICLVNVNVCFRIE